MSFREYLHEKAEESRHNETVAYLLFLAGAIFFVGGTLETLILPGDTNWFLFIPYQAELDVGAILGLTLIISGFSLVLLGVIAGMHYSRDRSWYMHELGKANSLEEGLMRGKSAKNSRKKKSKNI